MFVKKHTTSKNVKATKTKEPASKSAFSKKLGKVNNLLSKSTLLNA